MLESKENKVKIEGILNEVNLDKITYTKDGVEKTAVSGSITVRVEQKLDKNDANTTVCDIPVYLFVAELKRDNTPNPAYENVCKVMNEMVSIAASDEAHADRVRISGASIRMNEYPSRNGTIVSYPRITASFVSKIKKEDMKPEASFSVVFAIGQKGYELDKDGVETDKYFIKGILPQYGGTVDVVPFYPANKNVIEAVDQYWNNGDTVRASGRLNFTSTTKTVVTEVDFGEPIEETRTVTISELMITGGSSSPFEGDAAFDADEIDMALRERKARLENMKEERAKKAASEKKAPAQNSANRFKDLGF